jgi:chloride channel 7
MIEIIETPQMERSPAGRKNTIMKECVFPGDDDTDSESIESHSSSKMKEGVKEEVVDEPPPVAMPSSGKTFSFPRVDNIFKGMESLPYDEVQT